MPEIGVALQKEKMLSGGKTPRLIVGHDGEEVLSTLNQDAQTFRSLKQSGAWDSLKRNTYATGGTIGHSRTANGSNVSQNSSTTNVFLSGITSEQSFRENRSRVAMTAKRRYG
jgi:hypothetical protein